MRVLIVKTSSLGAIICTLPVLDYLQQVSDGIEVDWLVEESFREILEGNPLIAGLHGVRTKAWRNQPFNPATWKEMAYVRSTLRERAYDIVFDLQGDINSGIVTWLTGCHRRYGFDQSSVQELFNTRFTNNHIPLRRQDSHITDRALRMASVPFGKDYAGCFLHVDIFTSLEDDAAAELYLATLSDGLVMILCPGAVWKSRLWHEPGWIELGRELLDHFSDATLLIFTESQAERDVAERIAAEIGRQTRLLPQLSLKGFTALVKKIDLLIGGDSWPVHLAAAAGTPTVSFYRSTDSRRNSPRGFMHRAVQSPLSCARCLNPECKRDQECRESVTVASMFTACRELLHEGTVA